MSGFIMS